jgi:hypothetical protein
VDFQPHDDRYQSCARRGTERSERDQVSFAATLLRVRDETPVDGPVNLVAIRGTGEPVKLVFGSLYTRPSPTPARKATYQVILHSREGDCVQVSGTRMSDDKIWIVEFVNLNAR